MNVPDKTDKLIEDDYQRTFDPSSPTSFLPGTSVEIIREPQHFGKYTDVLFDFDGTLSLIREGWPQVMVPMMVEILLECGTDESQEELSKLVMEFVMRLTGKQTLYQMIQLRDEVVKRGGVPRDPLEYKNQYHDLLMQRISKRRDALASGEATPSHYLVPGSLALLGNLISRGCRCYLASGTDEVYVREEAELLRIVPFFEDRIYGAKPDILDFSKAMVIKSILSDHRIEGAQLLGFGDGYVEIENVKSVGGTAVAVASDESGRSGTPDPWKRERLVGIGADLVVPDFGEQEHLISYLFDRSS